VLQFPHKLVPYFHFSHDTKCVLKKQRCCSLGECADPSKFSMNHVPFLIICQSLNFQNLVTAYKMVCLMSIKRRSGCHVLFGRRGTGIHWIGTWVYHACICWLSLILKRCTVQLDHQ
jgi:hypothetical protein